MDDMKLVTVSYDEATGLEVDFEGMNAYEAWSYLTWATQLLEDTRLGANDHDD